MPLQVITVLVSALMVCVTSCTPSKPDIQPEPDKTDKLVGRVAAVYFKENYLLVQKYRTFDTSGDSIFYSRGTDGSVNSLKMTGQKLGQFYVADLSEDIYTINDPVFMRDLRKTSQVNDNELTVDPTKIEEPVVKTQKKQ